MKVNKEKREKLRKLLVSLTGGCGVQEARDKTGWPCGTCFIYLLNELGLNSHKEAYKAHNDDYERHNEVWRAILQIRDA